MRLLWPGALLLLLLIPLFVVRARRFAAPALRFPEAAGLRDLPRSLRSRLAFLPGALALAALALAAVALARPQTGITEETGTSLGVDIVLALDISSSMRAEDFAPANRLTAAKEVLEDFVNRRTDDRLGAVAFARNAVTLSPLTLDHGVLTERLREVNIGDIPDGTAIGNAIAASVNRLDGSEAESRVIVLLTDGVSNAGEIHPLTAAGLAKTRGIRVYTVGAGSQQGGRMVTRRPDGSLDVRRAPGIDEEMLTQVADATGGRYFRARDSEGLRAVYEEIDALERTEIQAPTWTSWSDDGPLPRRLGGDAPVFRARARRHRVADRAMTVSRRTPLPGTHLPEGVR